MATSSQLVCHLATSERNQCQGPSAAPLCVCLTAVSTVQEEKISGVIGKKTNKGIKYTTLLCAAGVCRDISGCEAPRLTASLSSGDYRLSGEASERQAVRAPSSLDSEDKMENPKSVE